MTTFDDREQAFEAKFAHDEEMRFRAEARCNKMLGLWAADLLGHTGNAAERYAADVATADLKEVGHEDVIRKVATDLSGRVSIDGIREKMAELLPLAIEQVLAEV